MIFQPIYEKYIDIDEFSSDYVKNSSLKTQEGLGSVFVYNKGNIEKISEEGYDLKPKVLYEDFIQMSKKLSVKVSKSVIKHAKQCIEMLDKMQETEEEKKELYLGITYEQCVMETVMEGFERLQ